MIKPSQYYQVLKEKSPFAFAKNTMQIYKSYANLQIANYFLFAIRHIRITFAYWHHAYAFLKA